MAEYTVVKVEDVPDQAANLGEDPELFEVRFLRNDLGCEHCGVTFARYGRGFSPKGHTQNRQEVKIGAPNTGPGDSRDVPDGFGWPD